MDLWLLSNNVNTINLYFRKRDNCLTSNYSLVLTNDRCVEYFVKQFEEEKRILPEMFSQMIKENNYNTIYNYLFCIWNISNNRDFIYIFENKNDKYLEKIVQAIKTNKIEKIARIGLLTIKVKHCLKFLESFGISNLLGNPFRH